METTWYHGNLVAIVFLVIGGELHTEVIALIGAGRGAVSNDLKPSNAASSMAATNGISLDVSVGSNGKISGCRVSVVPLISFMPAFSVANVCFAPSLRTRNRFTDNRRR